MNGMLFLLVRIDPAGEKFPKKLEVCQSFFSRKQSRVSGVIVNEDKII